MERTDGIPNPKRHITVMKSLGSYHITVQVKPAGSCPYLQKDINKKVLFSYGIKVQYVKQPYSFFLCYSRENIPLQS